MNTILKVLVGSRAHGLNNEESDYDYRGVYVLPTRDILSLGYEYKGSTWIEGEKEDNTAWEIGHFLHLARQCNPTIIEVFKAPVIVGDSWGYELRSLLKNILNIHRCYNAFIGYGKNQQKKFLDKKEGKPFKYAVAHVRTLYNLCEILGSDDFTVSVGDKPIGLVLRDIKEGKCTPGVILDITEYYESMCTKLLDKRKNEIFDERKLFEALNNFLIKIRIANL